MGAHMRSLRRGRLIAVGAFLGVALAAGALRAGEEPPAPEAAAPADEDPLTRVRYVYDARGRDIFTYRRVTEDVDIPVDPFRLIAAGAAGDEPEPEPANGGEEGASAKKKKQQAINYVVKKSNERYQASVELFLQHKFEDSMKNCEDALQNLERVGAVVPDLTEKLARLRKASEELKRRNEVETEFGNIDITIHSIVYKERSPAAVINGLVVKEGQFIAGTAAQVLRIGRGHVVFLYSGYKVQKQMR